MTDDDWLNLEKRHNIIKTMKNYNLLKIKCEYCNYDDELETSGEIAGRNCFHCNGKMEYGLSRITGAYKGIIKSWDNINKNKDNKQRFSGKEQLNIVRRAYDKLLFLTTAYNIDKGIL